LRIWLTWVSKVREITASFALHTLSRRCLRWSANPARVGMRTRRQRPAQKRHVRGGQKTTTRFSSIPGAVRDVPVSADVDPSSRDLDDSLEIQATTAATYIRTRADWWARREAPNAARESRCAWSAVRYTTFQVGMGDSIPSHIAWPTVARQRSARRRREEFYGQYLHRGRKLVDKVGRIFGVNPICCAQDFE
jgi:hypothetical protein